MIRTRRHLPRCLHPSRLLSVALVVALATLVSGTRPAAIGNSSDSTLPAHGEPPSGFLRSLDTMKESLDPQSGVQLTDEEIAQSVGRAASLNAEYVAVATQWEYTPYLTRWVRAARAAGLRVWFRGQPERWITPGAGPPMRPDEYMDALRAFVLANPDLFRDGDVFDPGLEPENGAYWSATWGPRWAWDPVHPNDATRAFNVFLRDSQVLAHALMDEIGRPGVITSVRSLNSWWALHPGALEHETVAVLGALTIDSYPDGESGDPAAAAHLRLAEIEQIWRLWGRPVILGEIGYPLTVAVADDVQREALARTLAGIAAMPYVAGINYWVATPGDGPEPHRTAIFWGRRGDWRPTPAALELGRFYADPPRRTDAGSVMLPWRFGPDLIADGGFERDGAWTLDPSFRIEDRAAPGRRGLRVPGDGEWANAYQLVHVPAGVCHVLSVRATGPGAARLDVLDAAWQPIGSALVAGGAGWRRTTLPFVARDGRGVIVAVRDSAATGSLDLDDIELRRCPGPAFA